MIQNLMFSFACIVIKHLCKIVIAYDHESMMAYYAGSLYFFLIITKKIHVYNLP